MGCPDQRTRWATGVANDWYFLAMLHWRLDHADEARRWYDKALAWMAEKEPQNEELLRFRAEAEETLGLKKESAEPGEGAVGIDGDDSAAVKDNSESESQPALEASDPAGSSDSDR